MGQRLPFLVAMFTMLIFVGCAELGIHDTDSLFFPGFRRSEVVGFIAGLGTTFAALPDLIAMLRRRSSKGMNPMMAATMGAFQIVRDCAYGDGEWSIRSCSTMT